MMPSIRSARDQMSRTIRLMGDLLDVARDQSGRLVPELTPVARLETVAGKPVWLYRAPWA